MTRLAVLLGDPVAHSLSPLIHNVAFAETGISARYYSARTPAHALSAAVEGLRRPHVLGANITIPHKESVLGLVDVVDESAGVVGAVNTIVRLDDGSLVGHNTDVHGFLAPLERDRVAGCNALLLGSGGAARAAAFALASVVKPASLTVAARRHEAIQELFSTLSSVQGATKFEACPFSEAASIAREADLIINATPIGMHPEVDHSPLPGDSFRAGQIVYDLIYAPRPSRLLRDAEAGDAQTIDGLEMLIAQAAAAFLLWTGREMPEGAVRMALINA